ncbi:Uu.00g122900.m01.CDS01 [Anthostomella pinea]|uniref:Uu.00g122900.m01.CDS01 n=1 Tax=Anthostomella pinea TaxID=933095 RepID=A0AAI8VHU1_9PEZI|nr:Uu.00g122900.m01.CDS01 [Anthostomella pinea]
MHVHRAPSEERESCPDDDDVNHPDSPSTSSTTLFDYAHEEDGLLSKESLQTLKQDWPTNLISHFRTRRRTLRRILRRQPAKAILVALKCTLLALCIVLTITPLFFPSYTHPPKHYHALKSRCQSQGHSHPLPGCANAFDENVFISVSLYDPAGTLARSLWADRLLEVIRLIGPDRVYLSIYENDSGPEGASALESLKTRLRCRYSIVNDAHVDPADFPTLTLPDGSSRVKRLAYLSELRNRPLRPLDRVGPGGVLMRFDKILFLNDVAFDPPDAVQLLFSTNVGRDGRAHYLSACALDYYQPFLFYDLYASRDAEGYSMGLPFFPLFSGEGPAASRAAMLDQRDAVPVKSCWSGMVAMQAQHVQHLNASLPDPQFHDIGRHVINPKNPSSVSSPVRFRYEPELFFDACECCLFQADVARVAHTVGDEDQGMFVNPYVRVAYKESVLRWLSWARKWERLFVIPHAIGTSLASLPTHNPHRTVREGEPFTEEVWMGEGMAGRWRLVRHVARNGMFCGVRDFQTLRLGTRDGDINWENIKIPTGQTLHQPT